ncbi:MAG TPA: hypothetical protein VHD62_09630 [Opitutaceae bacterium]|nr:hypothetical protein [Opitutaceae bacterium]
MLRFRWTLEARYRVRLAKLLDSSVTSTALGGSLEQAYVSRNYQAVLERTCLGADPAFRRQILRLGLGYLEGSILLLLAEELASVQLGRSLFLDRLKLAWMDHEGLEFGVETIIAVFDGTIVVATGEEFELDERFYVDRQLLRVEVGYRSEQMWRHRQRQTGERDG